jgi:hypothetical protein
MAQCGSGLSEKVQELFCKCALDVIRLSVFSNWFLCWSDFNRVRSPGRGGDAAAAFSATGVAFQWVLFCT